MELALPKFRCHAPVCSSKCLPYLPNSYKYSTNDITAPS